MKTWLALGMAAVTLGGDWEGSYSMVGPKGKMISVPFKAHLVQTHSRIDGSTVEPNLTEDSPTDPELTAKLTGTIEGNRVSLEKQYNGQGGKAHRVSYQGDYFSARDTLTGHWLIGSEIGAFTMKRIR
jgi:hypothetical protein